MMNDKCKCSQCKVWKKDIDFYHFKNGLMDTVCKTCRLGDKKDYRIHDYLPLMELYDIPCFFEDWNELVEKELKKCIIDNRPYESIFGKYLSKMKMKAYHNLTYKDGYH